MNKDIKKQVIDELHKLEKILRVIVKNLNYFIQADLVEMQPYANVNKGYRYILVVIKVFSKLVWVEPIKRKKAKDVTAAMKKVLSRMKRNPKHIQTDLGK